MTTTTMTVEYAFRGPRRGTAHAHAIYDGAPNPWSACHLATEPGHGAINPDAKQCRHCVRAVAGSNCELVDWLPEWDRYLQAVHRVEHKAREEVRELFYGPRRPFVPAAPAQHDDGALSDIAGVVSDIDAMTERLKLMNERACLQRGELPEDEKRRRDEGHRPEALAALRAENESMAADLRRKQLRVL